MKLTFKPLIIVCALTMLTLSNARACSVEELNKLGIGVMYNWEDASERTELYAHLMNYFNTLEKRIPETSKETRKRLEQVIWHERFARVDYQTMEAKDNLNIIKFAFRNLMNIEYNYKGPYTAKAALYEVQALSWAILHLTQDDLAGSLTHMSEIGFLEPPESASFFQDCKLYASVLATLQYELSFGLIYMQEKYKPDFGELEFKHPSIKQ